MAAAIAQHGSLPVMRRCLYTITAMSMRISAERFMIGICPPASMKMVALRIAMDMIALTQS